MKYLRATLLSSILLAGASHAVIINGEGDFTLEKSQTWAKKFPSVCQVLATYDDSTGSQGSGVLISPTSVLTAAHNVRAGQQKWAGLIFDLDAKESIQETREIKDIIVHPKHGMGENYQCTSVDLAILKFSNPITAIHPVKLYEPVIQENSQSYVVGYGNSGLSHSGVTLKSGTRHMGTTRISYVTDQYLTYNFQPLKYSVGQIPETFQVLTDTDTMQSLPIGKDSGGPLLRGSIKKGLSVAGIYHGIIVNVLDEHVINATANWIPINPHLEWIRENIE